MSQHHSFLMPTSDRNVVSIVRKQGWTCKLQIHGQGEHWHSSHLPRQRAEVGCATTEAWILFHCAFPYSLWRERISVPLRRISIGGDVG